MVLHDVSRDFPLLSKVNYLSTASIGLIPISVIETVKDFIYELAQGGTLFLNEDREYRIYDDLRKEGAKLLGCDEEDIAVFNSVTEALNCIAWSLELKEGKIISTDIEFPTVTYPWLRIARKENIRMKFINAKNWYISLEDLLNEIDENTKVVVLSHVEYLTGQRHDIKKIVKRAHEVNALVIVDGVQAAGYIPLNVKELNVDVYITGSYKWLVAPFGAAIAYISKDLYSRLEPVFVGWRSKEYMWDLNPLELSYSSTARKFEYSTSSYSVKIGLAESIKYLRRIGIEKIYEHNMKLTDIAVEELNSIKYVNLVTPLNIDERGSIVTFGVEGVDPFKIFDKLRNLNRPIELTIRQNMIRISPHLYNTEEDILHFVDSLRKFLKDLCF